MASTQLVHINFTGGIVSPGYLKEVLEIAAAAKVSNVRFGLRQQLILDIPVKEFASFSAACADRDISFAGKEEAHPNIVSSYPAHGICTTDSWLREGVYKDIFSSFQFTPKLKVNICDSKQSFVPFFTGHVNWVSSGAVHFWYLYIRFPKTSKTFCFPEMVYTNDIAAVTEKLEKLLLANPLTDAKSLYSQLKAAVEINSKPMEKALELPKFSLPYYEGFNAYQDNYWLGIYRREESFPTGFLIDVCSVAMKTKIGQVYTTAWKSIIIKGIENKDRGLWDLALGKYRINVRHAANELNWQVEDNCEDGLLLKRHVIRYFDKEDVRTYGLSFVVKTNAYSSMFGSVFIRRQAVTKGNRLKSSERFEILYTADFNPNESKLISFRKDVEKEHLGPYLVSICKYFYERQDREKNYLFENLNLPDPVEPIQTAVKQVFQCKHCFTVYDEVLGDTDNNVALGTSFKALPDDFRCSLCEAGKEDFQAVDGNSFAPLQEKEYHL